MAQPRKLTPEQEQGVVELIKDGVKKADIAKLYGVSPAVVQSIQKRNGIPPAERGKRNMEGAWRLCFLKNGSESRQV